MAFFLLERTDDDTVPEIAASQFYTGALKNSGEDLKLYDNSGNLIDEVNCSSGWFAGDNKTKQTMERINPLTLGNSPKNWQTSQNPGGTPKAENSSVEAVEDIEVKPQQPPDENAGVGPLQIEPVGYPTGIIFNEVLPSPEGPDAENEWIEIFNQNNFEVNLSGWKIKDGEGKITIYAFPKETKSSPKGYLVLLRPETKITLNNSGDSLSLIQPDGKIRDSVNFGKAPLDQSYNRTPSGWFWSTSLTPGSANIIPQKDKSFPPAKAPEGSLREDKTAAIGEKISKSSNYLPPYQFFGKGGLSTLLIAFAIAIFSAIVILILKKTAFFV